MHCHDGQPREAGRAGDLWAKRFLDVLSVVFAILSRLLHLCTRHRVVDVKFSISLCKYILFDEVRDFILHDLLQLRAGRFESHQLTNFGCGFIECHPQVKTNDRC